MATTTTNLGLRKPAGSDTVNVTTDISNNMDTIDSWFGVNTPSTQAMGDAAVMGAAAVVSRSDHKHAMPIFGTSTAATSTVISHGASNNVARTDHVHTLNFGSVSNLSGASSDGTSGAAARSDHKHDFDAGAIASADLNWSSLTTAHVKRNAAIATTTSTYATISWDVEDWDVDGMTSTSVNPTRIVCIITGKYEFSIMLSFAANATGYREINYFKNGTTDLGSDKIAAANGASTGFSSVRSFSLVATDYIEIRVLQSSGGALSTNGHECLVKRVGG